MLEVSTAKEEYGCLSCCDKSKKIRKVSINRDGSSFSNANIVTIHLCNDCLRKLAKEFVPFS